MKQLIKSSVTLTKTLRFQRDRVMDGWKAWFSSTHLKWQVMLDRDTRTCFFVRVDPEAVWLISTERTDKHHGRQKKTSWNCGRYYMKGQQRSVWKHSNLIKGPICVPGEEFGLLWSKRFWNISERSSYFSVLIRWTVSQQYWETRQGAIGWRKPISDARGKLESVCDSESEELGPFRLVSPLNNSPRGQSSGNSFLKEILKYLNRFAKTLYI